MAYNPEKYHRRSIRLKGYDYSQPGNYFITICTQNRECILGDIENCKMKLNDIGLIVEATWNDLPNHNSNIILNSFVIMPNHVHGIIRIVRAIYRADLESAPTPKNHQLSEIIRQFKSFSTRNANRKQDQRGFSIWQRNYYERIIRNPNELEQIRQYIINNPRKWEEDENHPKNIKIL